MTESDTLLDAGRHKENLNSRHQAFCVGLRIDYEKYENVSLGALLEEVLRQGKVVIATIGRKNKANLFDIDNNLLYNEEEANGRPTKPLFRIVKSFTADELRNVIRGIHNFRRAPYGKHYVDAGKAIKDDYKFTEAMFSPAFLEKWGIEVVQKTDGPKPLPPESETQRAYLEIHLANGYYMNPALNPRFEKERNLLASRLMTHLPKSHFTQEERRQISVKYEQRKEGNMHYAVAVLEAPSELQAKLDSFGERYYSGRDVFGRSK
jgi:hypothetical protein